jgi:hypothetical protein
MAESRSERGAAPDANRRSPAARVRAMPPIVSADIEIYGYAPEITRARALQAALRHLASGRIGGLSVSYTAEAGDRSSRQREAGAAIQARASDEGIPVEDAADYVARFYDPGAIFFGGLLVRCGREGVWVDLVCSGDSIHHTPRPPTFRLHMNNGYKRLGASWQEIEAPLPLAREEVLALGGHRWAEDVEALLPIANGASADGFTCLWLGFESGSTWPFDSYAVAHASEESLALDFARGWLATHASVPRETIVRATRDELRALVATTSEVNREGDFAKLAALGGYDGSLARSDAQRLLDVSPDEILQALEAVVTPAVEIERLFASAEQSRRLLSAGNPSGTMGMPDRTVPYGTRLRRWPAGALLLHTYQFRPVWPAYRDAAALLLGRPRRESSP